MLKCLVKMKTQCFILCILYIAGLPQSLHGAAPPGYFKVSYKPFMLGPKPTNPPKPNVNKNLAGPKICAQKIITRINNRYASTVVTTTVTNTVDTAQEYIFSYFFPNDAFITGFVIETNDKNYTSYILENEEARKQFKSIGSIQSSESAEVRNSQKFSVSLDLEAHSTVALYLTYEELLIKDQGRYEYVVNVYPGQVVEDLHVEIFLEDSGTITNLKVPNLRTGNEIENPSDELDPQAFISEARRSENVKSVRVLFMPNEEEQRKYAVLMKTNQNRGLAAQFVVQYDVSTENQFGEIIVSKNYFVNFFAPKGLDPMPKHIVFVLDTSYSMHGKRITQLKAAMKHMLNQLRKDDLLNLVEFNNMTKVWNFDTKQTVLYSAKKVLDEIKFPEPFKATPGNIKKAIECVNAFKAKGDTDILSALKVGLKLVEMGKKYDKIQRQPLIMFLTDGIPTVGERRYDKIKEEVRKYNSGLRKTAISMLGFGNATNDDLLISLASRNMGHFKHIYDANDSQLQIEQFFNTISDPVLIDINFNYKFSTVIDITKTKFPIFYEGSQLVVAGEYDGSKVFKPPVIDASSAKGPLRNQDLQVYNSTNDISHHWAFLTTKQILNSIKMNSAENTKDNKKKVLDVSLKYSFVTPVSSMVIVKPNGKGVLGTAELTGTSNSNFDSVVVPDSKIIAAQQGSSNPSNPNMNKNVLGPQVCEQKIITHINNRYASTVVTTSVGNSVDTAQEYIFSYFFPNNAFITGFVIETKDKNYTSYVLENEKARKQFKSIGTIQSSKSAQVRNSQKFSVSVNLEAHSAVTLYLTYEELLVKDHGRYEHVVNIYPGQVVENLVVEIFLKETGEIIDLKVPNLRTGNEIENPSDELNPQALISEARHSKDVTSVKVLFMPNETDQRKYALLMKTNENRGLAGQFVVQYDVSTENQFGEIIVSKNYFVNFLAPKGLDPMPKHIVFALDTSGSMNGRRITQLKAAMKHMLNQLRKDDLLNLVEFNDMTKVWNLDTKQTVLYSAKKVLDEIKFPVSFKATPGNIKKAIECVNAFKATGPTNILSPLKVGLKLVEMGKKYDKIQRQPLIMLLTDGLPTRGETRFDKIKEEVRKYNSGLRKTAISLLGFGNATDDDFLKSLASRNMGNFKHIYDANDSQFQIEQFFNTISDPILVDINLNYNFSAVKDVTKTQFPICYEGSQLVVAGEYDGNKAFKPPVIEAFSAKGPMNKQDLQVFKSNDDISHHWAFLTTKQLLNDIKTNSAENTKDNKKKVLDVSLKYSFVSSVSSMVIVKPNEKVVLGTAELTGQSNSNNSNKRPK